MHYYGIAALLVTLLPTLARAQAALPNVYPPPEFDKPYEGYLILKRPATEEEVKGHCHHPVPYYIGCASRVWDGKVCAVFIVADEVLAKYGLKLEGVPRHEIGHCHGWPKTHPGAIRVWDNAEK